MEVQGSHEKIVIGICQRTNPETGLIELLTARMRDNAKNMLRGMRHFPGGDVVLGETEDQAVIRHFAKKVSINFAINVRGGVFIREAPHKNGGTRTVICFYFLGQPEQGSAQPYANSNSEIEPDSARWDTPEEALEHVADITLGRIPNRMMWAIMEAKRENDRKKAEAKERETALTAASS